MSEAPNPDTARQTARMRRRAWLAVRVAGPLIAAHFAFAYRNGTTSYIDLQAYVHGQARLPFQYRALTGWIIAAALHLPGLAAIAAWQDDEALSPASLVLLVLTILSALWILHSARQAASTIVADRLAAAALALTFFVTLYVGYEAPSYHYRFAYPYDLPSLALFFAAFVAILQARHGRLLVVFTLATLSRETAGLLIPILVAWRWPARGWPPPRTLALPAAMVAIWVGAKLALAALYAGQVREADFMHQISLPGGMVVELANNVLDLASPFRWPSIASAGAWLWLPVLLFWQDIDHKPLRRAIGWLTPAWLLAMLFIGRLREARVFEELTILYWLAGVVLVEQLLKKPGSGGALSPQSSSC